MCSRALCAVGLGGCRHVSTGTDSGILFILRYIRFTISKIWHQTEIHSVFSKPCHRQTASLIIMRAIRFWRASSREDAACEGCLPSNIGNWHINIKRNWWSDNLVHVLVGYFTIVSDAAQLILHTHEKNILHIYIKITTPYHYYNNNTYTIIYFNGTYHSFLLLN